MDVGYEAILVESGENEDLKQLWDSYSLRNIV